MILSIIVVGLLALVMDTSQIDSLRSLSLGMALFVKPDAPDLVVALADTFNVFYLWSLVLVALGLRVVVGITWGRAWLITGLVLVVGLIPSLLQAFATQLLA